MINIGIIGLGGITKKLHIPSIKEGGKFRLYAAADVYPDDGTAQSFGIEHYYDDYRKMLKDPEIDAVLISSPHDLHVEHSIAAFQAGKHVLLEKPIARDLHEASAIMEAADKADKTLMIGLIQRFNPAHNTIKQLVENGNLGRCLSARIDHYQNFNPAPGSWWRSTERVGGGSVIGSGVHRLDLLRWMLGEPVSVYARSVNMPERLEAEACAHAVIEFEGGAIADFSINWCIYKYLYSEGFSLTGTKGTVQTSEIGFNTNSNTLLLSLRDVDNGEMKQITPAPCESMFDHFASCIETGKTPLTSGMEGYKTLQLIRAIYYSVKIGEVIVPMDITY